MNKTVLEEISGRIVFNIVEIINGEIKVIGKIYNSLERGTDMKTKDEIISYIYSESTFNFKLNGTMLMGIICILIMKPPQQDMHIYTIVNFDKSRDPFYLT